MYYKNKLETTLKNMNCKKIPLVQNVGKVFEFIIR